jgi:hypothetical protein
MRNLITALYTELAMLMVWWCWQPPRPRRPQRVKEYQRQWGAAGQEDCAIVLPGVARAAVQQPDQGRAGHHAAYDRHAEEGSEDPV